MIQNGVTFRSVSPDPGGGYWPRYGRDRKSSGKTPPWPCQFNWTPKKVEEKVIDVEDLKLWNALTIKRNELIEKGKDEEAQVLLEALKVLREKWRKE